MRWIGLSMLLAGACPASGPASSSPEWPDCDEVCGDEELELELRPVEQPDYWADGFPGAGLLEAELRWEGGQARCCLEGPCANQASPRRCIPDDTPVGFAMLPDGAATLTVRSLPNNTSLDVRLDYEGTEVLEAPVTVAYQPGSEPYEITDPGDLDNNVRGTCDACSRDLRVIDVDMEDIADQEGFAGCRGLNGGLDPLVGVVDGHELGRTSGPSHRSVLWQADAAGSVVVTLTRSPSDAVLVVADAETCRVLATDVGAPATVELSASAGERYVIGTDRQATLTIVDSSPR